MNKRILTLLASGALALTSLPTANAIPTLRLTDSVTHESVTIADESGSDDLAGIEGAVSFVGSVGGWSVDLGYGFSKPFQGSAAMPSISLGSLVASSTGGGTLIIDFSDDFFGPMTGDLLTTIGGIVTADPGSTIEYNTYGDASNALFGKATSLTSQGVFGSGAFNSDLASASLSFPGMFSLTQEVIIVHGGAGISSVSSADGSSGSFGAELRTTSAINSVPDSGSTIFLVGIALAGVEGLRRRLRL